MTPRPSQRSRRGAQPSAKRWSRSTSCRYAAHEFVSIANHMALVRGLSLGACSYSWMTGHSHASELQSNDTLGEHQGRARLEDYRRIPATHPHEHILACTRVLALCGDDSCAQLVGAYCLCQVSLHLCLHASVHPCGISACVHTSRACSHPCTVHPRIHASTSPRSSAFVHLLPTSPAFSSGSEHSCTHAPMHAWLSVQRVPKVEFATERVFVISAQVSRGRTPTGDVPI